MTQIKNFVFFTLCCFAGLSTGFKAEAKAREVTIWSDMSGFLNLNCKTKTVQDTDFAVSDNLGANENFEVIRSESGSQQFRLSNYSLIELLDDSKLEGHIKMSVISPSINSGFEFDKTAAQRYWGTPKASTVAGKSDYYIGEDSVQSLLEYVIEPLSPVEPPANVLDKDRFNLDKVSLDKTLWQAQILKDSYVTSRCCVGKNCTEYVMFNVYKKSDDDKTEPKFFASAGVNIKETALFKTTRLYPINGQNEGGDERTEDNSKPKVAIDNSFLDGIGADDTVTEGLLETVVCLANANDKLKIRKFNLDEMDHELANGSKVKIFQGWDQDDERKKEIDGVSYNFVRVQTDEAIGYAPKEFLKQKSECESLELQKPVANKKAESSKALSKDKSYYVCTDTGESLSVRDMGFHRLDRAYNVSHKEQVTVIDESLSKYAGIDFIKVKTESGYERMIGADFLSSEVCANAAESEYHFPVFSKTGFSYIDSSKRPTKLKNFSRYRGYQEDWGVYGARRSSGKRAHAATDLYQDRGQPRPSGSTYTHLYYGGAYRAMTSGRIVRRPTAFYLGTYRVVILHDDNTIGLYGETYGTCLSESDRVSAGQKLGYIKWVGANSVPPMLHFENYNFSESIINSDDGWKGSKNINGRNSKRNNNLFDRTELIQRLEERTF